MTYRIEVLANSDDGRARAIEKNLKSLGVQAEVRVVDVFTSEHPAAANSNFVESLVNPVIQKGFICHPDEQSEEGSPLLKGDPSPSAQDDRFDFNWALEIGYLPGVTDNIGHTAEELLELSQCFPRESGDLMSALKDPRFRGEGNRKNDTSVFTSRLYLIKGPAKKADIEALAGTLSNKLIQRVHIKDAKQFAADGGMDVIVPRVMLDNKGAVAAEVDLNLPDSELEAIGKDGIQNEDGSRRGPLGMSLLYMQAVRDYFKKEGRKAKDIEIETLAQTWSEHCKHTIFASPIDDIKEGIYRHYIKRATNEIRAKRGENDFCVSVFSDNAGGIIFDENWLITDKVETHNSPSALDPFGGAITGIVGVNRDCVGFGQGAKPVINRYGFCLAPVKTTPQAYLKTPHPTPLPKGEGSEAYASQEALAAAGEGKSKFNYFRDPALTTPILSPETIMNGVVAGVNHGGNCSGIPTPQGFVYFDDDFAGKPLVFVGTIGLIPRVINGKPGHEKKARPGDKIMMIGGRVGRDGIHGATFSSVALDQGSPATAVQIGDPITQKKMSDAIIKELRDQGLYTAITDNGAGGLSSSVGEMAGQSGGFEVELERVPLKYPGMAPWEIWISESQERMTLAVPPENTQKIIDFLARRGVEATVIGTYTDSGRAIVKWHGEEIMNLTMDFLHDGVPETPLKTTFTRGGKKEPIILEPLARHPREGGDPANKDRMPAQGGHDNVYYDDLLLQMLSRLNICSREFIAVQYDHEVQGGAVLKPLQGPGRLYAEATITKPVLTSPRGVVLSQGLAPRYSRIDTHAMAAWSLDMAVRNAVAAGADFNHLALLDNFCWCSSDEPERLGQLKRASEAIYDLAVLYGTPFISGKDSMFNDFKGFDASGKPVKISAPPTLLISSIGVIPDIEQSISHVPKAVGDLVYLLGETKDELGASEYYDHLGHLGNNVPVVNAPANQKLYKAYSRAARKNLIASALAVNYGGLAVALAKKAIAGQMGMDIYLSKSSSPTSEAAGQAQIGDPAQKTRGEAAHKNIPDPGFRRDDGLRTDKILFSESAGRILVTVAPDQKKAFEKAFDGQGALTLLGHVAYGQKLNISGVLQADIPALDEAYKAPLRGY